MGQIKAIVDRHCADLKFDANLAKRIERFVQNFINKSPDHVQCLGSHLTGVHRLTWTLSDRIEWEEDILGIDARAMRQEILAIPYMDDVGYVAADNFNITCCWLVHKFYTSKLSEREKERAMKTVLNLLQYKLLSSIHAHYFRFPVNQNVAEATYAELSKKFDIKIHGSWRAVIDNSTENLIEAFKKDVPRGAPQVAFDRESCFRRFDEDTSIVRVVQDIQFRLRDKIKNIWAEMAVVIENDMKFGTTASTIELDNGLAVRDIERHSTEYTVFIKSCAAERDRFIKTDLVQVVKTYVDTMPANPFDELLLLFTGKVAASDKKAIRLLDLTMEHLFNAVLTDRKTQMRLNDPAAVIVRIRGLYSASRSSNGVLEEMKEITEKWIRKEINIINNANVSAIRTGFLIYVVLRTMVKGHYG